MRPRAQLEPAVMAMVRIQLMREELEEVTAVQAKTRDIVMV